MGGGGLRRPEAGRAVGAERVKESNSSGRTAAGAGRARTRRCIRTRRGRPRPGGRKHRRSRSRRFRRDADRAHARRDGDDHLPALGRCRRRAGAAGGDPGRPRRWLARRVRIRRTARSWGDGRRPCPARGVAGVRVAWRGTLAVAGLSGPRFGAWRAWRVCGTGDRRGDRPGSSAGGSDSCYRGATRGWSSCSERPKPLGVASTMGSRQAWGRTRSRMMRGAAFRPLLPMRPQIMWVGLAAWGPPVAAAGAGVSRDAPWRWNRRAAPGFGSGVREGVLGADSRPFGNDGPMSGTGPCSGNGVPSRRRTGTGALGECQCIDALQTLTAASFVKPEDWIYGSNPGNWIAKYNTR